MAKAKCDVRAKKKHKRCQNLAYAEVYWKKGGWSYLCKEHLKKEPKKNYCGYCTV